MAEAEENSEQSMEEILQSIKQIIADEDEPEDEGASDAAAPDEELSAEAPADETTPSGATDDVLELTELVQSEETDDAPEAPAEAAAEPEVLAPKLDEEAEETDPQLQRAHAQEMKMPTSLENLVSEDVAKASSDALSSLMSKPDMPAPATTPSPVMRSGETVENLVVEALKPMLKEWLDANLQTIVERTVEREVRRISDR